MSLLEAKHDPLPPVGLSGLFNTNNFVKPAALESIGPAVAAPSTTRVADISSIAADNGKREVTAQKVQTQTAASLKEINKLEAGTNAGGGGFSLAGTFAMAALTPFVPAVAPVALALTGAAIDVGTTFALRSSGDTKNKKKKDDTSVFEQAANALPPSSTFSQGAVFGTASDIKAFANASKTIGRGWTGIRDDVQELAGRSTLAGDGLRGIAAMKVSLTEANREATKALNQEIPRLAAKLDDRREKGLQVTAANVNAVVATTSNIARTGPTSFTAFGNV